MEKNQDTAKKQQLFHFVKGILGFEDIQEFSLRQRENGPVWELCPRDGGYPQFVAFAAERVADCYCPELSGEILASLKAESSQKLTYFVLAVVPQDIAQTTVNLRSPVVVNFSAGLAAQVVLENTGYPMRYPIFQASGRVK